MTPPSSPYVLVPGAGGDGWYWSRVAAVLRAGGHDVVVIDLPAGAPGSDLDTYADAIVAAIGDRRDVIVTAHSLGGFSAPLACGRADVAQLLLVCAMVPFPGETAGEWWETTGQSAAYRAHEAAEGRDPDAPFDDAVGFFHDVAPEVVAEAMGREDREDGGGVWSQPWPLDAWPDVPTRVLVGRHDRIFPCGFQQEVTRDRLGLEPDVIDAGHLAPLARPDAVAAWMRARADVPARAGS